MFDLDQFRMDFRQFGDAEKYPDDGVMFWGELADAQVCCSCDREKLVFLLTAHFLECADKSGFFSATGSQNGTYKSDAATRTVGPITISKDAGKDRATDYSDAGMLNSTLWGKLYLQLNKGKSLAVFIV